MTDNSSYRREASVNEGELAKQVADLEKEVARINLLLLDNQELRRVGIKNGSKGVKGGFLLIFAVFLVNAVLVFAGKPDQFAAPYLLGLAGIVGFALVAYFGFIFRYTVSAKVNATGATAGTTTT